MSLPDLEAWAIFARVAELRSFTATADALGISKPTVSKAIRRLEARLKLRLFHRSSRRLSLTESGAQLVEHARRLLAEGEAAEDAARESAREPVGRVRLAAPMSFGLEFVAPMLPDLLRTYPGLSIDLALDDARVDLVAEGFDLALRIGALEDSALVARKLCDVPVRLFASPAYLAGAGQPGHPRDLERHACLGYAYADRWRLVNHAGERLSVRPQGPLRVNNGSALIPALCQGLGIAMLPEMFVADELRRGRLEIVLSGWSGESVALHLVQPPGGPRPARVTAVAEFLAERLARGHGKK